MSCYIGIDLGGTSIKGGRVESGKILRNEFFPVNPEGTRESIFKDICNLIGKLWTVDVKGIGFAVPAVIDFGTGTIYGLSNIPQFNGFAIQKVPRLAQRKSPLQLRRLRRALPRHLPPKVPRPRTVLVVDRP